MTTHNGIFGSGSNFDDRFIPDYANLRVRTEACKAIDCKVVLTSGSFDILHQDHCAYLEAAGKLGGILVVGVDSDAKIKKRKGPDRPIVPELERVRMLTYLRSVSMVTLKDVGHERWALIKAVRPDILVATKATYTPEEIEELKTLCGEIVVLEPMGSSSTTARIRLLLMNFKDRVAEEIGILLDRLVHGDGSRPQEGR